MLLTCSSVRGALDSQSSSEMTVDFCTCGVEARDPEAVRGSGGRRRLKPPGVEGRDMGGCLDEEGKSDVEEGQMRSRSLVSAGLLMSVAGVMTRWRACNMAGCLGAFT